MKKGYLVSTAAALALWCGTVATAQPGSAPAGAAAADETGSVITAEMPMGQTPKVGQVFPDFWGKTWDGKDVRLSDYKGKVVLVDFWATWCGPCRSELPNVKNLHTKYHDRGFDVIAVSLDKKGDALKKWYENAETTLPWPSIYDGQGWQAELGVRFGIHSIPAAFVLDREGRVVATNARGAALWSVVGKLLDPSGEVPPDMSELFNKYLSANEEGRATLEVQALKWAPQFQDEVNQVTRTYLDGEPGKDGAEFAFRLLATSVKSGKEPHILDTAASAAYHLGDSRKAMELQTRSLKGYAAKIRGSAPDDGQSDAQLIAAKFRDGHELIGRLALYQAEVGDMAAARATLKTIEGQFTNKYSELAQKRLQEKDAAMKPQE